MPRSGAILRDGGGVDFRVWVPGADRVTVAVAERSPLVLQPEERGWWSAFDPEAVTGELYGISIDGSKLLPDPVSRALPEGVHGRTLITDRDGYAWRNSSWDALPLQDYVFYELHIGTFTPEGTFAAAAEKISYLKELGITCVEVMPVTQFPGERNWGYDGVSPYSVHGCYGGPDGFKHFIDSCHAAGIAVCLDVVYNHLGPEGNYFSLFGPYFTESYRTPWGPAVNFDGPGSDTVRDFFIDNVRFWFEEYKLDALRLDAVHGIFDSSPRHILQALSREAKAVSGELGRTCYLIAESDLNDPRMLFDYSAGGHGMDAQWCDDFHHSLHVSLTGERMGYYSDFTGPRDLVKSLGAGFVYDGRYSEFRQRTFGAPPEGIALNRFVFSAQNHDQIGNRASGDRLTSSLPLVKLRAAAALQLLSPGLPLLFMGEEYGETAPFQFFIDHGDVGLVEAVRKGRREEFPDFQEGTVPDPASPETFSRSRLDWSLIERKEHRAHLEWYRTLLRLRRENRIGERAPGSVVLADDAALICMDFPAVGDGLPGLRLLVNLSETAAEFSPDAPCHRELEYGVESNGEKIAFSPYGVLLVRC